MKAVGPSSLAIVLWIIVSLLTRPTAVVDALAGISPNQRETSLQSPSEPSLRTTPRMSPARRRLLAGGVASTAAGLASAFLPIVSPPAHAVKERNEILCGTGFFTNIWQYRCTDLGDISDEGQIKALSPSENGAADALLRSKFGSLVEDDSGTSRPAVNEGDKKKPTHDAPSTTSS